VLHFLLACVADEVTGPPPDPPLPDLAVEPCNGRDDDEDGFVDEGNDLDLDGIPDCLDAEECDGLDNDGDGLVDDGFDGDEDGIGDCLDVETCDELDNDGDGLVDEDFPEGCDLCNGLDDDGDGLFDEDEDEDGDGVGDCLDVEECDGLDNDGDGVVDEEVDGDWDGICDRDDVEECDGWDNDGDGQLDEGFDADGDGAPDCWIPELCNGLDDDGDGEIDEGLADADLDGIPDCAATCGAPTEWTVCRWDPATSDFVCSYQDPITVTSTQGGTVVSVDLEGWRTLQLRAHLDSWSGYIWHVADSETSDGHGGDQGSSVFDGEIHNDPAGSVLAYDAQQGGTSELLAAADRAATPSDDLAVQVCEGWASHAARGAPAPVEAAADDFLRWDPTMPDAERPAGVNDTLLRIGLNRTVASLARAGVGLSEPVILLGR
jgi:hypothetical protein